MKKIYLAALLLLFSSACSTSDTRPASAPLRKVRVSMSPLLSWGPLMTIKPHEHGMWAVIGIYGGREENTFFRRKEPAGLTRHGTKELNAKDCVRLGRDIIHAVVNPLDQITAAIHVYGGDFFGTPRSEWHPVTLLEQPYDVADTIRAFEEANRRLDAKAAR